ncbi:hypothetical protein [Ruegeria halocynthiae]|uniref:hypothetical protein n=1 Tax=Ruegeria halocynthiae TaxID=985054 RepID=UPI00056C33AF|nr:hypothetical protein [Ruegeria halocynthiae]
MGFSTILEFLGLPTTLEILVAINVVSIVYLIWYAWYLFIANKGDLGALGLAFAAMAFLNLMGEAQDWFEDSYDARDHRSVTQQTDTKSN